MERPLWETGWRPKLNKYLPYDLTGPFILDKDPGEMTAMRRLT